MISNLAGVRIYNTTEDIPVLISEIKTSGFVWDIDFPEDENSLFIAAQQRNELSMIDIHDLKSPKLLTIFQIPNEYGLRVTFVEKPN